MLHPGNEEIQRYFDPSTEVPTFRSVQELIKKTRYYLEHDQEREVIARAGHQRAVRGGYYYDRVARELMQIINQDNPSQSY